jgi:hypothetical protein
MIPAMQTVSALPVTAWKAPNVGVRSKEAETMATKEHTEECNEYNDRSPVEVCTCGADTAHADSFVDIAWIDDNDGCGPRKLQNSIRCF